MADLGHAARLVGRVDLATTLVERSIAQSLSRRERGYSAWSVHALGEILLATAPLDEDKASECFREALANGSELGMRPLVAHCHLGLGKLYRRTGKREHASNHLSIATTMYREMGMRFWLEQADAELG